MKGHNVFLKTLWNKTQELEISKFQTISDVTIQLAVIIPIILNLHVFFCFGLFSAFHSISYSYQISFNERHKQVCKIWGLTDLFRLLSVLWQIHSLFQSEFSTVCDLVLPLSISSILSFPWGHTAAPCIFFLVFPSCLSFPLSFIFPSVTCFRKQFLCKMWPIQLAFLLFVICTIFISSWTLCTTT